MSERSRDILAALDAAAAALPEPLTGAEASALVLGLLARATTIALSSAEPDPPVLKDVAAEIYDLLVNVREEIVRSRTRQ